MRRRRLDDRDDLPTSVLLRDYPFEMVRLACTRCERRGQYRKSTLLARFGPYYGLVSMRLDLAVGCPRIPAPSIHEHCGVIYPDLAVAAAEILVGTGPAHNGAGLDPPTRA